MAAEQTLERLRAWSEGDFRREIKQADAVALLAVVEAAQELSQFLEHEKETTSPPDELLSKDCVACESAADHDREDHLSEGLALKLASLHTQASDEGKAGE